MYLSIHVNLERERESRDEGKTHDSLRTAMEFWFLVLGEKLKLKYIDESKTAVYLYSSIVYGNLYFFIIKKLKYLTLLIAVTKSIF